MHTYLKWFIYSISIKILALKYMSVALLISQNNEYTGRITDFFFFKIIFLKKLKSWIKKHSGSSAKKNPLGFQIHVPALDIVEFFESKD